jgi:4-hydroxybenzoate polyprenyltransferase
MQARPTWSTWARLLRVHHYAKNALVFVPLLAAHRFESGALLTAFLAWLAFSLCASSVYLLNDIIDLADDRHHPTKRRRPLASGAIPIRAGVLAIPPLFVASVCVAAYVSPPFLVVLLGYAALTTAYSVFLKRMLALDVITLAGLYSIRVLAGGLALEVTLSSWLLAFCMAMFMSLALIKRYIELSACLDANLLGPTSRDYRSSDLPIVGALAAAAGFNGVVVFALYISSEAAQHLYSRPELLWLVCPLLMYWITRALVLAHRREMDDDPVVFALRDPVSFGVVAAGVLLTLLAI